MLFRPTNDDWSPWANCVIWLAKCNIVEANSCACSSKGHAGAGFSLYSPSVMSSFFFLGF